MAIPLIGGIGAAIVAGLFSGAAQIVFKVLASLGLGFVTYVGMEALVDLNYDQVMALMNALPPNTRALLGVLKVGVCLNIFFSALVMRMTLWGLNNDMLSRMRVVPGVGS
jgi:hypothetical protein